MFNIERWQEIFEAISKNKLRTFLTGVSVASGIFILIILLGVANGFNNGIQEQFSRDASTIIEFWSGRTTKEYRGMNSGRSVKMDVYDYNRIIKEYKDIIEYDAAGCRINGITTYKSKSGSYGLIGAMPDRYFLENASMLSGRFLNQRDYNNLAKVVVIGSLVAKELFDEDIEGCIGEVVTTGGVNYKIVGVFKDPGGDRDESRLYAPYSTLMSIYNANEPQTGFMFTLNPEDSYDRMLSKSKAFAEQVKSKLQQKYKVHPEDSRAIRYYSSVENSKDIFMLIFGMKFFFWIIGILTLIAGIVGVGNIMLIIVKERTKEIGIRKALGAQPKAIIAMILHEAIFITSISGVIGLFFGFAVLEVIGSQVQTEFILNPRVDFSIALSTVVLLIIAGAVAGYFPARYASKIKPIIALRDE